jgi:outer membrane protein assembly factor BamB
VSSEAWLDAATGVQEGETNGHVDGLDTDWALLRNVSFGSGTEVAIGYGLIDIDPSDGTTPGNGGLLELDGPNLPLTLGRQRVYHSGPSVPAPGPTPPDRWYDGVRAFTMTAGRQDCGPDGAPYFACPVWATELDGGAVTAPVLSTDESTVYAGSGSGELYALNAATGAIRWQTDLGAAPVAAPALANGTFYVPVTGNRLVAVSSSGVVLWTAPLAGKALQPAVANGLVFVASTAGATGALEAFSAAGCGGATCSAIWRHDTTDAITGAPAVSNGHIYIGTSPPDTAPTSPGRLLAFAPGS